MVFDNCTGLAAKPAARAARAAAVLSREEMVKVAVMVGHVVERGKKTAGELVPEFGVTPEGFPLAVPLKTAGDGAEAARRLNTLSKSVDELEFLKGGSAAGREVLNEVAQEGLSSVTRASIKRIGKLSKEGAQQAEQMLVTLNVARTEMMARFERLAQDATLRPEVRGAATRTRNSLQDHFHTDDLVGALRDNLGLPVRVIGSGRAWDHLGEVGNAVRSLENLKDDLVREMRRHAPGSAEYSHFSKEADAVSETLRRAEQLLEVR